LAAKHAPPLVLPSGVVVELHRRYGVDPTTEAATPAILERARRIEWGGRMLCSASPGDLLGVACHHVFVGHRADRRFRPRHVADCAVLLAGGAMASEAAALPGAAQPVRRSLQTIERGRNGGIIVTVVSRVVLRLEELRRSAGRIASAPLRPLFFPDLDYLAWRYGVPRASRLLPLLYLWRQVRGVWMVARGTWRLVTGR
jgi:hypothetical protein